MVTRNVDEKGEDGTGGRGGNDGMRSERGICSGDPEQARQAFVANTLGFWSEYHQVEVERKLICADLSETETTKSSPSY